MNWFLWTILACVVLCALGPLLTMIEDLMDGDGGYSRRVAKLYDDAAARGIPYADVGAELFLREKMAKLRRVASDIVAADPTMWSESLQRAKEAICDEVRVERPDLLPAMIQAVSSVSYGHILYPTEAQMVDRQMGVGWNSRPNEDQVASMRIVRPG